MLHSYSQEYPWTKRQHEGFVSELQSSQQRDILFSTEYLDTKRKDYGPEYASRFARYLQDKYQGFLPDLVYVTDDNALDFAIVHMPRLFPGAAVIFSGVNDYSILERIDRTQVTGVFEKKEIAPNLRIIDAAGTGNRKIAFVGDGSETDEAIKNEIRLGLKAFPSIDAVFISASAVVEIVDSLSRFPYATVFLTTIGGVKDAAGKPLSIAETIRRVSASGKFILLSMEDVYLEPGVLGGYVTSGLRQGQMGARLAFGYLAGKAVGDLLPIRNSPNEYIFEQSELEKHRIALPADIASQATILNPRPSFYQANRELILGSLLVLATLLLLTLAISVFVMSRKSRQLNTVAEQLQTRHAQLVHAKESLVEAQRIAHMGSWSLDLGTNDLKWSDEIFQIFEIDKKRFTASYEAFLAAIHPDDRDRVNAAYVASVSNRTDYEIQHRLLLPDGRIKYVLERGKTYYDEQGKALRSLGTVQDITEQTRVERRLHQWAAVFENTMEGVLITDDKLAIIDVNRAFTEITGYSKEEVVGKKPNIRRSERHDNRFYSAMWKTIKETGA